MYQIIGKLTFSHELHYEKNNIIFNGYRNVSSV